jgi:hypothetical protein
MFYSQEKLNSEVKRDQFMQSNLAYWSAAPREQAQPDPLAWEAGSPIPARAGAWVWLVLAIVIGLSAMLIVAL